MAKLSSKRKILIASLMIGLILIGAVVSIVIVFAATSQDVRTNVTISYITDGVAARVTAAYAKVSENSSDAIVKVSMASSDSAYEIEFSAAEESTTKEFVPEGDIELTADYKRIIYEYSFTNLLENPFTVSLEIKNMKANNMNLTYFVSKTALTSSQLRNSFENTSIDNQPVIEKNETLYIYVSSQVLDKYESASFDGDFVWSILKAEEIYEITLNNDGGTGLETLKVIPNAAMPVIDIPTKTSCTFEGYFSQESGAGTKYINSDGTSAYIADFENGSVLYASFSELPYTLSEDGTTLTALTTTGQSLTEIVIPEGVTTIGDNALSGTSSLESVTIPSSVETIGDSAFENCTSLTSVTFEGSETETIAYADGDSSLTTIGSSAFKGCTALTEITIPEGVTTIEEQAFDSCTGLTYVYLPTTLLWAENIMNNCSAMKTLECNASCIGSSWSDGLGFDYMFGIYNSEIGYIDKGIGGSDTVETLILHSGKSLLPDALFGTNITKLVLPETMESLGSNCLPDGITELTIPESVTQITIGTFGIIINDEVSSNLEKITINCKNLTIITNITDSSFSDYSQSTFLGLGKLSELNWNVKTCNDFTADTAPFAGAGVNGNGISVNIGANVEKIPNYLFFGSNSNPMNSDGAATTAKTLIPKITSLNFEEGVKTIGEFAFRYMYLVDDVYLPDSLEVLEGAAFKGATIKSIRFGKNLTEIGTKSASQLGQTFGWAQYLNKIIYDCENLTTIAGSQNLSSIGTKTSGVTVEIGSNVVAINSTILKKDNFTLTSLDFSDATNLKEIGANAFANNTSLISVNLPTNIEYVDVDAFSGCTGLTSLTTTYNNGIYMTNGTNEHYFLTGVSDSSVSSFEIAEDCVVISKNALASLTNISSLTIPNSVEIIYDGALKGLSNLTELILSNKLRVVGDEALSELTSITTLTIPATVESIGTKAFAELTGLQTLNYNAVNVSDLTADNMPFYVSTRNHSVTVNISLGVSNIPAYLFFASSSSNAIPIVTVNIANSVKTIGDFAFRYCDKLTSLTIPNSVKLIGSNAFRGGTKITTFVLGEGVETIEDYAFAYFYGVKTFVVNSININSVGSKAFEYLGGASSSSCNCVLSFGPKVEKIADKMFYKTSLRLLSIDFTNATSLVKIGQSAFHLTSFGDVKTIVMPESLKDISQSAFQECSITEITIGKNVEQIGHMAFYKITGLEKVYYNATNATIIKGSTSQTIFEKSGDSATGFEAVIGNNVTVLPDRLFHTTNLRTIDFGDTTVLTKFGDFCVYKNYLLETLTIPESVTYIGKCAVSMNMKIPSLNIPKNVSHIGLTNTQFLNNLTSLTVDAENQTYYSSGNCIIERATMTLIAGCDVSVIPQNEGILAIGECAFCRCSNLESVTIPATVKTIEIGAFEYCSSLTSVTIPANVSSLSQIFNDCSLLTSITVDAGNKTFYVDGNCVIEKATKRLIVALNNAIIPNDIKHYAKYSMYRSTIAEIKVNKNIESIAENTFLSSGHTTVYVDNAEIAQSLTGSSACGGLIGSKVTTVYIAFGQKVTDYISATFTLQENTVEVDGVTYMVFTK